jgi:predicted transcriptional regulator
MGGMGARGPKPTGTTPHRTIRVPDELWHRAHAIAAARGEKVTAVILRALENYVRRHRRELPWQEKETS